MTTLHLNIIKLKLHKPSKSENKFRNEILIS